MSNEEYLSQKKEEDAIIQRISNDIKEWKAQMDLLLYEKQQLDIDKTEHIKSLAGIEYQISDLEQRLGFQRDRVTDY
jgi:ElaB/YqjD/DUF883 family membrane-anchored ribosome-binding protein